MMIANTLDVMLTRQQRRHDALTDELGKVATKRDDAIVRFVKLDTRYRDLARKVGRSGKRLAEARAALTEKPTPIAPPKPAAEVKAKGKMMPADGDPLGKMLAPSEAKAAKLRDELRGERTRKRA